MKKIALIMSACFLISGFAFNQDYKAGLGARLGYLTDYGSAAFNVKHFFNERSAIDGSIGGGNNHVWVMGLYEINNQFATGWNWYYGIGGDIGVWGRHRYYYRDRYYDGAFGGVDGVIGVEYTFEKIPLNLFADAIPSVRLFPYVGFGFGGNIGVRFAIK